MDLKCIQSIIYHWGTEFEKDKFYTPQYNSFHNIVKIVTNSDKYWETSSIVAKSGFYLRRNLTPDEIESKLPGYKQAFKDFRDKETLQRFRVKRLLAAIFRGA